MCRMLIRTPCVTSVPAEFPCCACFERVKNEPQRCAWGTHGVGVDHPISCGHVACTRLLTPDALFWGVFRTVWLEPAGGMPDSTESLARLWGAAVV